ncbi:MAG: class I SAM-dependent RNA methyltransferase [Bryobacteraceae bacterium]
MTRELQDQETGASTIVRIEKLVYGGDGLARIDGQVALVPYVLSGDLVTIRGQRVNSGLIRAGDPHLIEAAPGRVTPKCEYFGWGKCGGCHYQHLDYALQVSEKKAILAETLQRQGGFRYEGDINALTGEPWHYRNRIQLHFEEGVVGYRRAGSHQVYPVAHCEISSPVLNEVIRRLQDAVKQGPWPKFLRSLEVFTNESEIQLNVTETSRPVSKRFFEWCKTFLPNVADGPITYQAGGIRFILSGGSFFQVNRFLVEPLMQEVLGLEEGESAVDLYSGAGLFSIPLAKRFKQVTSVERGASAFRDLERNARENGVAIQAQKSSAEEFLAALRTSPDLLIADPPRAGLGKQATAELIRIKPSKVVIVSCDPTTLARDLRLLLPHYELKGLTLVDLFPQTYHIETVAKLEKR